MLRSFFRDNGLTLVLTAMFVLSVGGMIFTGQAAYNKELIDHGATTIGLLSYLRSGNFLSALFENWESEFLQMAVYVVLTAMLFQRGSAESRDPDDPHRPADQWHPQGWRPIAVWIYERSLGLALALLFIASFVLHWWFSLVAANEEAALHGGQPSSLLEHLGDPQLWFESFQNWQSEFLSTALLVLLSIFLRHRGSPESKPVSAANSETGA
ncbi:MULTISPECIES: DUF6766 family protein [unclassified Chelatococcus]|uniref:DUF6766 family protein n=1 Tax=unclassified Chelatococcus TaxID=2638111 RepID=UPI001BD0D30C|nr:MULTISPECIES: DUF6766 family protein [unclassified Chelatococcus]MBS7696526.1 hypothetical protein [Chelatococcus sp. YT9]MBX3555092.1 hypothetical protein [Chelatococcus sp.]